MDTRTIEKKESSSTYSSYWNNTCRRYKHIRRFGCPACEEAGTVTHSKMTISIGGGRKTVVFNLDNVVGGESFTAQLWVLPQRSSVLVVRSQYKYILIILTQQQQVRQCHKLYYDYHEQWCFIFLFSQSKPLSKTCCCLLVLVVLKEVEADVDPFFKLVLVY